MDHAPHQPGHNGDPAVPPRLAADLAALYRAGTVPSGVDAAVLADASRRIGRHRRRRRLLFAAGPLAAAAGLALAVWLFQPPPIGPAGPPGGAIAGVRGDVDGNGRVDIVDALLLAGAVRDGSSLDASWDLSGDGVVTRADADAIAAAAVRLSSSDSGQRERAG